MFKNHSLLSDIYYKTDVQRALDGLLFGKTQLNLWSLARRMQCRRKAAWQRDFQSN